MENYVKRVSAKNFKGKTFVRELRPVSVLYGDNSIGKTATTDAIRIALLGYSPRHGKQPGVTFGFAGAPNGAASMSVEIEVGGSKVERTFELKKGSVKAGGFEGVVVPAVMLDANEWIKLSGPKKTEYVFNRIDLSESGFSTEQITARLKKDVKVDEPDEASERIIGEMLDAVSDLAEFRDHEKQTYQQWIDALIEHFKTKADSAKIIVEQMGGAIGATTQLQAQDGLGVVENVTEQLQAARGALQTKLMVLQAIERQREEQMTKRQRKSSLQVQLEGQTDKTEEIATLEASCNERQKTVDAYNSNTLELVRRLTTAQSAEAEAKRSVEIRAGQITFLTSKLAEDLKADCCPHCKSKGKGWKKALSQSVDSQVAALDKEIGEFQEKVKLEAEVVASLTVEVTQSKRKDVDNETLRRNVAADRQHLRGIISLQNTYVTAKARLEEIGDVGELIDFDKITEAQKELARQRIAVEGLEGKERQQIGAMQDAKRQEEARQAHAAKKIEVEIYTLASKSIKAVREEMMEKAFTGFMEKMNLIAVGIFPKGKLVFHDGQIGYWEGASFASMDYFGGTEEMLAFAGLSLTLAAESKFKIIIMDELGRVASARRKLLIGRMLDLVESGAIDQFIGIDVSGETYKGFEGLDRFSLIEVQ